MVPVWVLVHPSQILQPTLTIFLKNEAKKNKIRVSDCQIQTFLGPESPTFCLRFQEVANKKDL
jgi:hypothetical protein